MKALRMAAVAIAILSFVALSFAGMSGPITPVAVRPWIVAWVSPYDTISNVIEITARNGMVVNAPATAQMFRRTKSGTVWRAVQAPVTLTPGQHLRVTVPKASDPRQLAKPDSAAKRDST